MVFIMLFIMFGGFIILMIWLYKTINIKINNFRKAIYGITVMLLCYGVYMILYAKLGEFLKGFDADLIHTMGKDLYWNGHGISFILIPLCMLFVVLSIATFIIHFILKLIRNH